MQANRQYDVVVFGATGFTGELVAHYLLERYGCDRELRWAIAGRSADKLDALKDLAGSTNVVLTTVGPYALYGSALVAACVEAGTDYCDLAGEVQWIRRMIDRHHERAMETGAHIVHCCGFDSIPMDMGVFFLQNEARRRYGACCESIALFVKATRGSASGGTLASMINIIREARRDREVARLLADGFHVEAQATLNIKQYEFPRVPIFVTARPS